METCHRGSYHSSNGYCSGYYSGYCGGYYSGYCIGYCSGYRSGNIDMQLCIKALRINE